jgi:putative FmdB family regulatory protein
MPTYEYRCTACKHEFEQFQSMKDKPLRTCPACKKAKLERLIGTGGAIIFKGSGFYQTDYRSEGYKKAADADKPADKSGENKPAETKAESKTEAKPAPAKQTESKPAKSGKAKSDGKKS